METTAARTEAYIREHPYVKSCLNAGLINYSALARKIAEDLGIAKQSSMEAILIAARRFKDKLHDESHVQQIRGLLAKSELTIKNKMIVFILEKQLNYEHVEEAQKEIRKTAGTMYVVEGSEIYTVITQEAHASLIEEKLKNKIIKKNAGVALINLKSPKEIEHIAGVVSYLTSLFAENGINVLELFSCWTDSLFVVDAKDVPKAMHVLQF